MKMSKVKVLTATVALCATVSILVPFLAFAATVLDDQFADGISTNQDLASNSIAIYKSRSGTTRTDAVGSVEFDLTAAAGADAYFGHFTNAGSPITLGVGDSMTFSATFSLTGFVGGGQDIRFGLLNSNGTRQTA